MSSSPQALSQLFRSVPDYKNIFSEAKKYEAAGLSLFSSGKQGSMECYKTAYNLYLQVQQNEGYSNLVRGEAAYNMWLLAKDKRVVVSPTSTETSEQRVNSFLVWAAGCGCKSAVNALNEQKIERVPDQGMDALRNIIGR